MAGKVDADVVVDDGTLIKKFEDFLDAKGNFTSSAAKKLVTDVLNTKYKKYDVIQRTDSSVFSKLKDKRTGAMPLNKDTVNAFILGISTEIAKQKKNDNKLKDDDSEVESIKQLISKSTGPVKHTTKTSKTGGVAKMTDASHYTGSHKERFDSEGKGKGKEGRENTQKYTGYVGAYREEGTYDAKKK
ncbi:tubulin polymerization-promoting protein family member 3-like [Mercenaria mercenaria]|uniref:tubulin polymerization-promoting protein family member 3-like n=1 Tax=Mercenaria mercenaria TaxID=6596 RepID=UPI001E1D623C|nr:tubulin polymerization-promoting protein family member 3-like [Mercenaria mercenaria]XP_045212478.1 tubulin polymerization-promoting protein family member 3-like [Mercenaria mercenaria]